MASAFGKVRSRVQRGKRQWYVDFGRIGKVYSLKGEPFADRAEAESILRAIQGDVARGSARRLAVEKWLPSNARANHVERWLVLWLDDVEARVATGDLSPSYAREVRRWATPGEHGHFARLGRQSIHALDFRTLRAWQQTISAQGKTLWNITAGISAFLGWLVEMGGAAPSAPRLARRGPRVATASPGARAY